MSHSAQTARLLSAIIEMAAAAPQILGSLAKRARGDLDRIPSAETTECWIYHLSDLVCGLDSALFQRSDLLDLFKADDSTRPFLEEINSTFGFHAQSLHQAVINAADRIVNMDLDREVFPSDSHRRGDSQLQAMAALAGLFDKPWICEGLSAEANVASRLVKGFENQ